MNDSVAGIGISKKWAVIWVLLVIVFVAGIVSILQGLTTIFHGIGTPSTKAAQTSKLAVIKDASKAGFAFLVPSAQSPDWTFDPKSPRFDATEGVVEYHVSVDGNDVTLSQQEMPAALKPANTSSKFNQFVISSNVAMSEKVGDGEVYFRAATNTGGQVQGTVTVIFATSDILMFGQASSPLDNKLWVSLFESMWPVSS